MPENWAGTRAGSGLHLDCSIGGVNYSRGTTETLLSDAYVLIALAECICRMGLTEERTATGKELFA